METQRKTTNKMNVFEYILEHGDCEGFEPVPCRSGTKSLPGSGERIEIYRLRALAGLSLYHEADNAGVDRDEGRQSFTDRFSMPLVSFLAEASLDQFDTKSTASTTKEQTT